MEVMLDDNNREKRKHGEEDFPLAVYDNYLRFPHFSKYSMYPHWHEEAEFILIKSGNVRFIRDGEIISLKQGDVVFVPPRTFHAAESADSSPFNFMAFVFNLRLLEGTIPDACYKKYFAGIRKRFLSFNGVIGSSDNWEKALRQELYGIYQLFGHRARGFELGIKASLFKIFYLLFSNDAALEDYSYSDVFKTEKMLPALEFIKANYQDSISVDQLSELVCLSKYHFIREFKSLTGRTPIEFINRYRIHMAMDMLINTNWKLINIAYECGFNDMSYFIRLFHKFTGKTPAQYRHAISEKKEKQVPDFTNTKGTGVIDE